MAKYASRVKETTTTTGTGTINLDGAIAGFRAFLDPSNIADQDYVPYILLDADGLAWEEGYGKVIAGTPSQLERGFVMDSSNGGAAISLSAGTHTVGIGPIAATREPHIAIAQRTTTLSVPNATGSTISFESVLIDTDSMWSAAEPTKLTVPAWASFVIVEASIKWASNSNGLQRFINITSNNPALSSMAITRLKPIFNTEIRAATTEIPVSPGDYFEIAPWQDSGAALDIEFDNATWFSMRVTA